MADLIVDASLDDTNSDLKAILDEFNNCQKDAQEDQSIWGQSDVASAMNSFANNWWVHRGQIQSGLTTLSNNVDQACSTWSDADKQLADSLGVDSSSQANSSPLQVGVDRIPTSPRQVDNSPANSPRQVGSS